MGSNGYITQFEVRAAPVEVTPGKRDYKCNKCDTPCFYDGRCGDGAILMCDCNKADDEFWANDRR